MESKNRIEKTYCLYASDWHLAIMLLPFISNELNEKNRVYMKFEKNIKDKINKLTNKLKIRNKNEINNISWGIEINDEEYTDKEKIYIVSGDDEYMLDMNKKIELYYSERNDKVKIINCFDITSSEGKKCLDNIGDYTKVLTTKGEVSLLS